MPNDPEFLKAAEMGDTATVISLLDIDPELVNCAGDHDKTALHWAAEKNDSVTAAVLIEAGADIEAKTDWDATPLEWAAVMGSPNVGDLLIEKGAKEYNIVTAAGLGKLGDVKKMSDAAKDLISKALHLAARNGHREIIAYLLERGGDIDTKGFFGATGLHWAAINGHKEMVEFLVEHGADTSLIDEEFNATPQGWAEEGGFSSIAEFLQRYSERKNDN